VACAVRWSGTVRSLVRLVDSHAHIHSPQFDADREDVVARALESGLVALLDVGTDLDTSRAAVALAERYEFVFAAVGVHPHDAAALAPGVLDELRVLAQHPKVVAIGEIGLDYYRDLAPREIQRHAFAEQLVLAQELGLPVIVHSRDAHEDVLAILAERGGRGVLHSYAAGLAHLDEVLDLGFCVGISGPVTFRRSQKLRDEVATVPLDRLLIETDCPYLAPEPHRGRRNEPAYVLHTAEAIAAARHMSLEALAEATTANACSVFGLCGLDDQWPS